MKYLSNEKRDAVTFIFWIFGFDYSNIRGTDVLMIKLFSSWLWAQLYLDELCRHFSLGRREYKLSIVTGKHWVQII